MYAVVATGGKQYKVQEGQILRVEKLTGEVGAEIAFDQVLLVSDATASSFCHCRSALCLAADP